MLEYCKLMNIKAQPSMWPTRVETCHIYGSDICKCTKAWFVVFAFCFFLKKRNIKGMENGISLTCKGQAVAFTNGFILSVALKCSNVSFHNPSLEKPTACEVNLDFFPNKVLSSTLYLKGCSLIPRLFYYWLNVLCVTCEWGHCDIFSSWLDWTQMWTMLHVEKIQKEKILSWLPALKRVHLIRWKLHDTNPLLA